MTWWRHNGRGTHYYVLTTACVDSVVMLTEGAKVYLVRAKGGKPVGVPHLGGPAPLNATGPYSLQAAGRVGDGARLAFYQGMEGDLWCRPEAEFLDGRFVRCDNPHPPVQYDLDEPGKPAP